MSAALDRPVWNMLTGAHRACSLGDERARRFHPDYGPFIAPRSADPEDVAAMGALLEPRQGVAQIDASVFPVPEGWRVVQAEPLLQMVAEKLGPAPAMMELLPLGDADAPEMFDLARLTKPGPWESRTRELGRFLGVRIDGRLAAMTGERMRVEGAVEISAVCTHPDFRGRGLAAALTWAVARRIQDEGLTPFLHVFPHNTAAVSVYEALGFRTRREMALRVAVRSH